MQLRQFHSNTLGVFFVICVSAFVSCGPGNQEKKKGNTT